MNGDVSAGTMPNIRVVDKPSRMSVARTAVAGFIGNALEWFDFAVYGYFASDIGHQFFPRSDPAAQQLLAFSVFALGFGVRPIGGLVLGVIGDRIGRKALLTLSIALMGGATFVMGLLPTYNQIGIAAPLLLVLMRILQGLSVGAEFTGSMVYTTEASPVKTRGIISSSTAAGTTIGFILGSGSAYVINSTLTPAQVGDWGWRLPFVTSILFCILGWYLRSGLQETDEGKKAAAARPPLLSSIAADWLPMIYTFGIVATTNAAYYLTFTYVVERRKSMSDAGADFLLANTLTLFAVLFAKPLGGWLSDYIGRRRLMLILTGTIMLAIVPAVQFMIEGTTTHFIMGQLLMAVPIGMALGLQGAMVVEIYPLRTRVTSMSLGYSVTLALAGGTAPLVSAWLIQRFGNPLAPAYYILLHGIVGLALLLPMKETNTRPLDK